MLLSATSGQLADRYEISRLIRWIKLFGIGVMAVVFAGFLWRDLTLLFVALGLMGVHSTLFGPVKYAILPQHLRPEELIGGNGLVEMGTFVAILLGTIAGGVVVVRGSGVGWRLVLAEDVEGEAPVARWIELHDSTSSSIDYLVCASPISGSNKLRQLLWNRASGVILMSATLTSCGTFDLFLQQSGLSVYTAVQFLRVESPFDYRSNARLVIPAMRTDPGDARRHTDEVVERMPGLVQTLGTLVLFASGKQMREV